MIDPNYPTIGSMSCSDAVRACVKRYLARVWVTRALSAGERADIEDGDDEAAITCAFAAIGRDAYQCQARGRSTVLSSLATCDDAR